MALDTSFLGNKDDGSCSENVSATVIENIEAIAACAYGFLSIILYIVLIKVIISKPTFHHPFFFQFIMLSITNIILWLSIFTSQRIIPHPIFCDFFYPIFSTRSLSLKSILFGYYISLANQIFTVISMSVNRMTVVLFPFTAAEFWRRHQYATIISVLILSFTYSFYLYDWGTSITFGITGRLLVSYLDGWPHIPFVLMSAILSIFCLIIIVVTTAVTFCKLYNLGVYTAPAEVNLFRTSVGFSLTTLVVAAYSITLFLGHYIFLDPAVTKYAVRVKGLVFDLNCLLPAWLMFLTNRQIRYYMRIGKSHSMAVSVMSQFRSH